MFRKWDVARMKIRKNGCALKQLKGKKDKYIVQKKNTQNKNKFNAFWGNKQLSQRASFSGSNIF